ncbi:TKL protein kinase [Fonticula alba]|uniref:TKL protein kinase n=1 Tax=Fonticula alba TaxID=691883 RepID=A0A058Z385_FONAL|nr:TKL protein kinase [Fonticula alba]KCV68388.1 TKL protein kinase [Fonticula alba]|eukprot:XP_009497442.1 TKL protein kinase [Fonticula alba]
MASCSACAGGLFLLHGAACVDACPRGYVASAEAGPAACLPCHASCSDACTGPGEHECRPPGRSAGRSVALAVGLAAGLLVVVLLLLGLALWYIRQRGKKLAVARAATLEEDATMLNTIVELALPGAIVVDVDGDFAPETGAPMGSGAQARVYAGRAVGAGISARLGCPETVAIKRMKSSPMKPLHVAMFQNEVSLMWLLREQGNIVRLFGYSQAPAAIVMERFDTDMGLLLHSEVELSSLDLADMARQWASGLEAMHAHGVAHCDVKPGNVFVSRTRGSWRVALGDLGASRNLNVDRSSALLLAVPRLNALSARYAAPELLAAVRRGTTLGQHLLFPADIYAAAVMLNECLERRVPWAGMTLAQIADAVQAGDRPPGGSSDTGVGDFIAAAWQADPERRPAAETFRQRCAAMYVAAGGLE